MADAPKETLFNPYDYTRDEHEAVALLYGYKRGLEDAAKIAEAEGGIPDDSGSAPSDFAASGYNEACIDIAAAIRAKIKESDDDN